MKFKRKYFEILKGRISEERRFIQAVTGPRQTGKTTLVKQLCEEITIPYSYVSADDIPVSNDSWLNAQWEVARLKLRAESSGEFLLIIDEIQKIYHWSETVKKLWDEDTMNNINLKIIILGSSGLMIQKGLSESLAGRFELINIPHWSFTEMESCFGFDAGQYAWFGGYPGGASLISDETRWKEYIRHSLIEATISKDILMLTNVTKPALMKQVFELGVHYSSQIFSFNKMLGQLQDAGNSTTLSHYLQLLDTAGLLGGIPKYYKEVFRQKSSSPKWQVKNTGLFAALSPYDYKSIKQRPVDWGRVVENAIGAHLLNMSAEGRYSVFYWRHRNEEVDFVIKKDEEIIAIEVKSGNTKITSGMKFFQKKYNPKKILLAGTSGLLWTDFLKLNPADLFD